MDIPKKDEKARKLKALSKGKGVKPPRKWFRKMYLKATKQYPELGTKRKAQIVGGIWSSSSVSTKKKIVRKYQR